MSRNSNDQETTKLPSNQRLVYPGERELVRGMKAGEGDAFRLFVKRYESRIYSYALKMCGNREDALEILQEAFTNAFQGIGKFRGEARLSTWLYRIAANSCRMHHRKSKFEPDHFVNLSEAMVTEEGESFLQIPDESQDPVREAMGRELGRALKQAILRLPPRYRSVFVLRDIEKLTAEEVSGIMGISIAAVKSRLHRARLFLRKRLEHFL